MKLFLIFMIFSAEVLAFEETEAMRAARLGCTKQKQGRSCHNYANMLLKHNKESEADEFFTKACELKFEEGCEKKRWESNVSSTQTTSSPTDQVIIETTVSPPETDASISETIESQDPAILDIQPAPENPSSTAPIEGQ